MEKPKKEIKEIKTPDYTRKAINNYRKDKKMITVTLSMNDYNNLCALGVVSASDVRRVLLEYIENNNK